VRVTTVEEKVGVVIDYLNRIGLAVIRLTDGNLRVGDRVRIAGKTSELSQVVESLQLEHEAIHEAVRGTEVAMKVQDAVRELVICPRTMSVPTSAMGWCA
jgi:translation initiation factor IF-2